MSEEPEEDAPVWIGVAEELLDEGKWKEVLELLDQAPEDHGVRWLLSNAVWIEVDRLDFAREDLAKARHLLGDGDPDVLRAQGRLAISEWKFDEAQATLDKLDPRDWGAQLLLDRSFVSDALGDYNGAHALLEEAHALDPESNPSPIRLDEAEFKAIVSEAAEALPENFVAVFERVPVVIDAMPRASVLGAPESGTPPDVLGLYIGPPLAEYDSAPDGEEPPVIFLFQRNLERIGNTLEQLREEIRITLYHELAHALGFEEEGVEELGLS